MIYVYSTPWGDRRAIRRQPIPHLALDLAEALRDDEEDRAWELLHSLGDQANFL